MNKLIFMSLLLTMSLGCVTPAPDSDIAKRTPQQSAGEEEDLHHQKFENSFQSVMNASGANDQERDQNRARQMSAFIRRQMGIFYLAQDLLLQFDDELNALYAEKLKNQKQEVDTNRLDQIAFQLRVGRELSERNLHELQYFFERLLQEAYGTGDLQRSSYYTLVAMNKFFDEAWKAGDQWAVVSLAQEFSDIFENFKNENGNLKVKTPKFLKYTKLGPQERQRAIERNRQQNGLRKKTLVDSFLQKEWTEYQAQAVAEKAQDASREPNQDVLYPDAGGPGNVSGNKFSPGVWSITFDDGPHPKHTPGMLEALRSGGYRGTFFWLSENMRKYPSLVQQVGQENSRRASHSFSHANLPKLGEAGLTREIDEAAEVFEKVVGAPPTFFRCPYGACGPGGSRIRQKIANRKMLHVFWNVDSLDWQDKNAESIFDRTVKQMEVKGKGIVLFHDIHPQSVEATRKLIGYIRKKQTWKLLPMDEIVQMETGKSYPSP